MRGILIVLFFYSWSSIAQNLFFIENKGQWNIPFESKIDIANGALFLEENALTFNFVDASSFTHQHEAKAQNDSLSAHAYRWEFLKANTPVISYSKPLEGKHNYFTNRQRVSNLKKYQKVTYNDLYDGIDYTIYTYGDGLKYDWIVHPNAKPSDIKMKLEGVDQIDLREGRLHLHTSLNLITEERPFAYQWIDNEKVDVECQFILKNKKLSFDFPDGYNPNYELIIDPEMIFSSYSGSVASNFGYTATYDDYGFLYAGGTAYDIGYPITVGAYQTAYNGGIVGNDVVLTKYDTTGSFLIYSTYLGGSGDEVPHSLIVYEEELFVLGTTGSADFPVTENAFDNTFNGGPLLAVNGVGVNYSNGCDIYVSRLSDDGGELLSSTFLGGTDNDGFNSSLSLRYNYADQMRGEIDIDSEGNCYIASSTFSNDFPIVNSLIQPANNGGQDGVLVKMDNSLETILWSSYWGGSSDDALYSLALDDDNNIYAAGGTSSTNLTTSATAYASDYLGGSVDAFVTHFSNDGGNIINSTYFGSDQYDQSYFIELDNDGEVYLLGQSLAPNNTLVFNAVFSQPNSGQFVCKLSSDLSSLEFSTVFGSGSGGIDISPTAFLVDACNRIYCSGWGGATNDATNLGPGGNTLNLVTTFDAFQSDTDGSDFYLIIFEDNANTLSYASFFGGDQAEEHVDGGTSRFDKKGTVYQSVCAGCGGFSDFPTTDGAYSSTNGASCNNAVFKFDPDFPLTIANFFAPSLTCDWEVTFENLSIGDNNSYSWDFGDGTTSTETTPIHTYTAEGVYEVTLITNDPTTCNLTDTLRKSITIDKNENSELSDLFICKDDSVLLNPTTQADFEYQWFPATGLEDSFEASTTASPSTTTEYYLIGQYENCFDSIRQLVEVSDVNLVYDPQAEICGLPIYLRAFVDDSTELSWSVSADFSTTVEQDSFLVSSHGTYYIRATKDGCVKTGAIDVALSDDCCSDKNIIIPNAFTPNGDLLNDRFRIKDELNIIREFELNVFNRWGQKVFFSTQKSDSWDGFFKGELQPTSVFDYHLTIGCVGGETQFFKIGNISLIR